MLLMKVRKKKRRKEGKIVFIYLDDILVLSPSKGKAEKDLKQMVEDLLKAGFKINHRKSVLEATQEIKHLGQQINFRKGQLEVTPRKVKNSEERNWKNSERREKISSILGRIRSFLVFMPFLRLLTDRLCQMVNQHTV